MKIYSVVSDFAYDSLLPSEPDRTRYGRFSPKVEKRADWLGPHGEDGPSLYLRDPDKYLRGNFFYLAPGALVYDERVRQSELGSLLARSGEVLPARLERPSEKIFVMNPTKVLDCFDRERSDWEGMGEAVMKVNRYEFDKPRISGAGIFKLPILAPLILARDEVPTEQDDFLGLYRDLGFTGLKFEQIWEG